MSLGIREVSLRNTSLRPVNIWSSTLLQLIHLIHLFDIPQLTTGRLVMLSEISTGSPLVPLGTGFLRRYRLVLAPASVLAALGAWCIARTLDFPRFRMGMVSSDFQDIVCATYLLRQIIHAIPLLVLLTLFRGIRPAAYSEDEGSPIPRGSEDEYIARWLGVIRYRLLLCIGKPSEPPRVIGSP